MDKINLDKTKPQINITSPEEAKEYILNEQVTAGWSATDSLSGIETAAGTVPDGSNIDTATVGEKTFTVTALDLAGNQEAKTINYYVRYIYTSLSPAEGKKILKGRPFLVRFRLTDAQGNSVPDAVAKLYMTGPDGQEIEAISATHIALGLVSGVTDPAPSQDYIKYLQDLVKDQTDLDDEEMTNILTLIHNATDALGRETAGNQFHYYMLSQQYIFDPYTWNLQAGNWQLRIALDDVTSKYTDIELFEILVPLLDQLGIKPQMAEPGAPIVDIGRLTGTQIQGASQPVEDSNPEETQLTDNNGNNEAAVTDQTQGDTSSAGNSNPIGPQPDPSHVSGEGDFGDRDVEASGQTEGFYITPGPDNQDTTEQ